MVDQTLTVYNTLSRQKQVFEPLHPPFVGMYVCGPTVYGDAHLGHARPAVTFDLIFRYLKHIGFKVRYVRNITDVGHLENDADEGEDKIAKKARLDKLEPMEVVQFYTDRYHQNMDQLNVLRPSIEPKASGHVIEQIEMIRKILHAGYAYEANGSVYFDVEKYSHSHDYGKLSGRVVDELLINTRALEGQGEKKNPFDFALWKKAQPEHIMRWPSPWSEGFPGWHMECSAMGTKYLGETFDIHGGGMDLLFPHHEAEIAQATAALGHESVRYWLHNNMVTINGQKMGKSLNNFITLNEFFNGSHPTLEKSYSPMAIRFFTLQAHYRSTLDFSNEALQAAEKGFKRLMTAMQTLQKLKPGPISDSNIKALHQACYEAMNDDFNSPMVIAQLFEGVRIINSVNDELEKITLEDLELLKKTFQIFITDILGLTPEEGEQSELIDNLVQTIITLRKQAREGKDFKTSDLIRDELKKIGIVLKDNREGTSWERE
ncbi:MAG: cysteine--tRNA ligase [Bacteroidales bacterium]|nr:cysteine--tRNA ligase [Bacteroidales bacterium]MDZ4204475.1 cysteine--tRNA ligase [Bacteroidales bacterium]